MKLLVSGCSVTSGFAFDNERANPNIWCNRLANHLNADLINVAEQGSENQDIFLRAFDEIANNDYDLAIIETTALTRFSVSPTNHGFRSIDTIARENILSDIISDKDYEYFHKIFLTINNPMIHWWRLLKLLSISKSFKTKIVFVNGLIGWSKDFFNNDDSDFHRYLMNDTEIPDDEISKMLDYINKTKKDIDLTQWLEITPMVAYTKDTANDNLHPGPETHNMLFERIKTKL